MMQPSSESAPRVARKLCDRCGKEVPLFTFSSERERERIQSKINEHPSRLATLEVIAATGFSEDDAAIWISHNRDRNPCSATKSPTGTVARPGSSGITSFSQWRRCSSCGRRIGWLRWIVNKLRAADPGRCDKCHAMERVKQRMRREAEAQQAREARCPHRWQTFLLSEGHIVSCRLCGKISERGSDTSRM